MVKVSFIGLACIALLFIVLVATGPTRQPLTPEQKQQQANSFSPDDHSALGSLNSLLAPLAPKLAGQAVSPLILSFDLSAHPTYKVTILPEPAKKFRSANFLAQPNKYCASVIFTPSDDRGFDHGKQQSSDSSGSKSHPDRFAFTLSSSGGTLEVKRSAFFTPGGCVIQLETSK